VFTAALVVLMSAATLTPVAATPTCRDVAVPVTMPLAGTQIVAGNLCWTGEKPTPTVQILLAGATYNRVYWDFPYQPDIYSYVRRATVTGYTTLALDRPGTGASSHPAGPLLTNASEASAVHQVVNAARLGKLGATFTRVLLAGHSYGSVVAWYEAATYADVDALLITGMAHEVQPAAAVPVATSLVPASLDPTYLTTRAGTRKTFWHGPHDDPAVIATDEQAKDTVTTTELADTLVAQASPITNDIAVPVLIAEGQQDLAYAAALNHEATHYPKAPCVDTYELPDAGHDLNLAPRAPDWFAKAMTWANRVLGPNGNPPRC
jgi:pimeloyl-ACP methyl ester carboxylesterase